MINIYMRNSLWFDTTDLDKQMVLDIKKDFRVVNPAYVSERAMIKDKKKLMESDTPKFINLYDMHRNGMMEIPRGSSSYLCEWFDKYDVEYDIVDERVVTDEVEFQSMKFDLFEHQKRWVKKGLLLTQGTIESPCGSGKTIGGIALMARCRQRSLVIVPDNELLKQWCASLVDALGDEIIDLIGVLSSQDIHVGDVKMKHGVRPVTISTNATAHNMLTDDEFVNYFGFVLIDECHMIGARTFRETMHSFPAKYKYGLTATPFRHDSLTELITAYCGTQFYTVTDEDLEESGLIVRPLLEVIATDFNYKYNPRSARYVYSRIIKALEMNEKRNQLIVETIAEEVRDNRMVLVISTRVNHCHMLAKLLREEFPKRKTIRMEVIAGEEYDRSAVSRAKRGEVDVIFAVNRALQGLDIKPLETVMIVAPRKARGEIQQIVGRVMRADTCFGKYKMATDKQSKVIDFVDEKIPMLLNSYSERYKVYRNKCDID